MYLLDPPARPCKKTTLASVLVERPTDLYTHLCCHLGQGSLRIAHEIFPFQWQCFRASPWQSPRLYKIPPLVEHFSATFSRAFHNMCIIFRQYISLKWARFGIKLFCLTDKNGYLHSFRVYSRKDDPIANLNGDVPLECTSISVTSKTTVALLKSFLNKGYHLYVYNWYSSVPLLEYLHEQKTMCTSTA